MRKGKKVEQIFLSPLEKEGEKAEWKKVMQPRKKYFACFLTRKLYKGLQGQAVISYASIHRVAAAGTR